MMLAVWIACKPPKGSMNEGCFIQMPFIMLLCAFFFLVPTNNHWQRRNIAIQRAFSFQILIFTKNAADVFILDQNFPAGINIIYRTFLEKAYCSSVIRRVKVAVAFDFIQNGRICRKEEEGEKKLKHALHIQWLFHPLKWECSSVIVTTCLSSLFVCKTKLYITNALLTGAHGYSAFPKVVAKNASGSSWIWINVLWFILSIWLWVFHMC